MNVAATHLPDASGRLQGLLAGGTIALLLGAVLGDVAYATTYEIQWQSFAAWLMVGALVVAGLALLLAVFDLVRASRPRRAGLHAGLLAATWVTGLLAALAHAKDAWASMPEALVLSVIATALACTAAWVRLAPAGRRP